MGKVRSIAERSVSNYSHMTGSCTTIHWCVAILACVEQCLLRDNFVGSAQGHGACGWVPSPAILTKMEEPQTAVSPLLGLISVAY